jgi:Fission yeast centromere protein N-terminal domain
MENLASLQTSIPPPARKRRRAITDAERKAISDWWAAAPPKQKSHKKLRAWFLETHFHSIAQSSISDIHSHRYKRLDKSITVEFADRKKDRPLKWPDLESALNEWQI